MRDLSSLYKKDPNFSALNITITQWMQDNFPWISFPLCICDLSETCYVKIVKKQEILIKWNDTPRKIKAREQMSVDQ